LIKLAPELRNGNSTQIPIATNESAADIENILQRFEGNRALAAAHLGISRTTLWRRLKSG
jgi:propionate catabolism operon transcriptional regulator